MITGNPLTKRGIENACDICELPASHLLAITRVETNAVGFNRDTSIKVRFERAKFPHTIKIEGTGWPAVDAAYSVDPLEAYNATSWGLPQIMGYNAGLAGYLSSNDMEASFTSEDEQLLALARFLNASNLARFLQTPINLGKFSAGYNGVGYARNNYDVKLRQNIDYYERTTMDIELRTEQMMLYYAGAYLGNPDGLPGSMTERARHVFANRNQT